MTVGRLVVGVGVTGSRGTYYHHEHGEKWVSLHPLYIRVPGTAYRRLRVGWLCLICGFVPGHLAQRLMLEEQGIDVGGAWDVEYGRNGTSHRNDEAPGVSLEDAAERRSQRFRRIARMGYPS